MSVNVSEGATVDSSGLEDYSQKLQDKILFGLMIYPALSPSMLHVFLGTSTPTKVWKAILQNLIATGVVVQEDITLTSPHDRVQSYTVLHLQSKPYDAPSEMH